CELGDSRAGRCYLASQLGAEDLPPWLRETADEAAEEWLTLANTGVGSVDRRSANLNEDLIVLGYRPGDPSKPQDLRWPVPVEDYCSHQLPSLWIAGEATGTSLSGSGCACECCEAGVAEASRFAENAPEAVQVGHPADRAQAGDQRAAGCGGGDRPEPMRADRKAQPVTNTPVGGAGERAAPRPPPGARLRGISQFSRCRDSCRYRDHRRRRRPGLRIEAVRRAREPEDGYLKMLTARAITSPRMAREVAACTVMAALAHRA